VLRCRAVKHFFRLWAVLATAYLTISLAISWIVSGSLVYPTEAIAHILIVPLLQAALLALLFRKRDNAPNS